MTPFEWAEPSSLAEAISLLDADDPSVRPVAGGTALMLMMKAGVFQPSRLVSLQRIEPEFSTIQLGADGELRIGAMASLSALEQAANVIKAFPVLGRTLRVLSNVRVRNVACVGGALAHGDPHMDLPPVLFVLGARASVVGPQGTREVAVEQLYAGYYETVLDSNELIAKVVVPPLGTRKATYAKVTTRSADDWPALGVAISLDAPDGVIRDARIAVSAATEKVMRLAAAEAELKGLAIDDDLLRRAGDAAAEEAPVVEDGRGSAAYKRELLRVFVGRAIRRAASDDAR
jgi:aerobic carbon-monoxide dehydrogenase medium subunit